MIINDAISKYERNDNSPSIEMALKISNAFEVSVDYLVGE
ncbi:helix-turn-helix domain-containing protein [Zunongwangia pacifica]